MYNFETDIELLELRARSQEEKYRSIDQEILELVEKKTSGQRRELLKKLCKEDCEGEERVSLDRWENTNLKWFDKYENNFLTFFNLKNPLLRKDDFMPPRLRENIDTEESPEGITENQNTQDARDDVVIVTGSSYANATGRSQGNGRNFQGTTYICKNVQSGNKNASKNKPAFGQKQPKQPNPVQNSQNKPPNKQKKINKTPRQNMPNNNDRRPQPGDFLYRGNHPNKPR